jgi:hypothetical protein
MTKRLLAVMASLLLISSCSAQDGAQPAATASPNDSDPKDDSLERARQGSGDKEPSVLDVWNVIVRKAEEKAGAIKSVGKPRVVPKGAKPEIIINYDGLITFDGKPLRFGEHIDKWRATLPKDAVCSDNKGALFEVTTCDWDSLGLSVLGSVERPNTADQLVVHLNFEAVEAWMIPDKPGKKVRPENPFTGYLEIDGYAVNRDTRFWELRVSADRRRDLRCGLTECSHPHGGGGNHTIAIRLDGKSKYDRLRTIAVGGWSSK